MRRARFGEPAALAQARALGGELRDLACLQLQRLELATW